MKSKSDFFFSAVYLTIFKLNLYEEGIYIELDDCREKELAKRKRENYIDFIIFAQIE